MDSEIDNYLKDNKSLVIAPAGHGKTTLLTKCILRLQTSKNILILTHTHAGIASIKQKMSKVAKTEHSHPLGMVVSTHFRCGKGVKRGLKNGALPFNID